MSRAAAAFAFLLLFAAPAAADPEAGTSDIPVIKGPQLGYVLECQGCHLADGSGVPGEIPRLRDFMGYFLHIPEGRDFIARVPGVAQAPFDDAELAALINWTLQTYSRDQLPKNYSPYTADEVGRLRKSPVAAPRATRARLIARLRERGVLTGPGDGFLMPDNRP